MKPGIVESHGRPALHFEHDVVVLPFLTLRVLEAARRLSFHREPPGHAKVHDQRLPGRQFSDQVLRPSSQARYPRAFQPLVKLRGKREAQVLPSFFDVQDAFSLHRRQESAANSLDFGKLWHGPRV
jgi:hypothetical protein